MAEKYLKKWKKFIKESGFSHQIYCDMDGVLVDFLGPIIELMNAGLKNLNSLNPKVRKLAILVIKDLKRDNMRIEDLIIGGPRSARKYMFEIIRKDVDFWANLPWTKEGKKLWNYIKNYNPLILTTPMDKASEEGKMLWVQKNLGLSKDKIYFSHDKYQYAIDKDGNKVVLIDDFKSNVDAFNEKGGIGILHKDGQVDKTINSLKGIKGNSDE